MLFHARVQRDRYILSTGRATNHKFRKILNSCGPVPTPSPSPIRAKFGTWQLLGCMLAKFQLLISLYCCPCMRMPKTANLTGLNCAARGSLKYRTQKIAKKSLSAHHRTTLSGYIFATKARVDNRKKVVKQQYLLHMSSQYGELRPTSGWDLLASFGHPSKFQRISRLGSVTARHSSSRHQPNFAALSRGRHLYSTGRPSRWALAHILVLSSSFFLFPRLISAAPNFRPMSIVAKRLHGSRCHLVWR